MLIPPKRMWVAVSALLLASVAGAAGGYLLGRAHILRVAEERLAKSALDPLDKFESMLEEEHADLIALQNTAFPDCSDAEIAFFRQSVFHSVYVKDLGRMRDGKIKCSAMLGREGLPLTEFKPAFGYLDGTKVYINLPPALPGPIRVYTRLLGDLYVTEDPNFSEYITWLKRNFEVNTFDAVSLNKAPASRPARARPAAITDRDAQGSTGDSLYATRCSSRRSSTCITTRGSLSEALAAGRGQLQLDSGLGALLGAVLVLIYALIYQRSRNLTQQLRRAIHQDALRLVYQPIVEMPSGRIVEAEALLRWTDEEGFNVSPDHFIHLAEERGFAGQLTRLVLRHALLDFAGILRSCPGFRLNINVTAADLADGDFLNLLNRSLAESKVAPEALAIEVTETSTANSKAVKAAIHQLRQSGHSVQIDDFGTGYSSLAYLKDLSVDTIKIDKSFTQAIGTHSVTVSILPQILSLARTLNLRVIVEGIETSEQARFFDGSGDAMRGQGWLYGRPVPPQEFLRNFHEQSASAYPLQH